MENIKFNFEGKTALITGASRGIGLAIANKFLENGASVINISKHKSNVNLNKEKYNFVQKDINDTYALWEWLNDFEKNNGRINILVNNAGVFLEKSLLKITKEEWDYIINVNLKSPFFLSQLIGGHMKEKGGGVIINACSFAATIPSAYSGVYAASKSALETLTKSMAAEFAPYNIRVNAFSPGVIETDMTSPARNSNGKRMLEQISLDRFGNPEEVANVVLFLASDLSSYINGATLPIDGGKLIIQNNYKIKHGKNKQ